MTVKQLKNVSASVKQRLLNLARAEKQSFNELLQYYAMERFLYRLSQSPYSKNFILKGALLLRVWHLSEFRSTMDIDLLGRTRNEEQEIISQFKEILLIDNISDGLLFDLTSIKAERILEEVEYKGIRILFKGTLEKAKVSMQIDIGFGDIVFPGPDEAELPTILNFPAPCLLCYSRESSIAEKFESMIRHRELNSRMKDFYDIWSLSQQFEFDSSKLSEAIRLTLKNRETELPQRLPAFSEIFIQTKQTQWSAYRRKKRLENSPTNFANVVLQIKKFLEPIVSNIKQGVTLSSKWNAPGPWENK